VLPSRGESLECSHEVFHVSGHESGQLLDHLVNARAKLHQWLAQRERVVAGLRKTGVPE
jgi:hypothetical protein